MAGVQSAEFHEYQPFSPKNFPFRYHRGVEFAQNGLRGHFWMVLNDLVPKVSRALFLPHQLGKKCSYIFFASLSVYTY